MLAKEMMTRDVITVGPDATFEQVAKLLTGHRISGVPVVNLEGGLMGIISEADLILRDSELHIPHYLHILGGIIYLDNPKEFEEELRKAVGVRARDLMTKEVIAVEEDTPLEKIATIMVDKKINRLPVVTEGKVVGIVSRGDLVRSLVK